MLATLAGAGTALARGGKLVVLDRMASRGVAKVVYASRDGTATLPIGTGDDDISVGVTVRVDALSAGYTLPAGAFDGDAGWRDNDASHATFFNRDAPAGSTGIRKASLRAGKGISLSAKTLGDTTPGIAVTGAPARAVDVRSAITTSAGTQNVCTHFAAADCKYHTLGGGAGVRLSCGNGIPDPGCSAFNTSPGNFTCTEMLGFSQTLMWEETPEFQGAVDDASWQIRFRAGGDVDLWADPNADAWNPPVDQDCLGSGQVTLCSPCAQGSTSPDRVLFTITLQGYLSDVPTWVQKIRAAIATIRSKHPLVRQIVLQPVVGGPHHAVCPVSTQPQGVRASFNHPYVDQAIAIVVGDAPDLVAGISPEVRTCADYMDDVGHLEPGARGPIGGTIGQYYGSLP
jgi:hypothetical protein